MVKTIKVFIEGNQPVAEKIAEYTTVQMLLEKLNIKKLSNGRSVVTYFSDSDVRPVSLTAKSDFICKQPNDFSYYTPTKDKDSYPLKFKVLWIGFGPHESETKYYYDWKGNTKTEITHEDAKEKFDKSAYYLEKYDRYGIQGIELESLSELFDTWIKLRNYIIVKKYSNRGKNCLKRLAFR